MAIVDLLNQAEAGLLGACRTCVWSPRNGRHMSFGVSCEDHGLSWRTETRANSMLIVQDPADTTPQETGRLCTVHNARNPSDKTARHSLELWNAAVALDSAEPNALGLMKRHYWTNAIMHGAPSVTGLRANKDIESARKSCSDVLRSQIRLLAPKVVIAKGTVAVNSLHDIGLLNANWSTARLSFRSGAHQEKSKSWEEVQSITVFATYHTSAGVVNRTLARAYDPIVTESQIAKKCRGQIAAPSVAEFLTRYSNLENGHHRGMRYLLNHWLDIGVAIREAGESAI